MKITIANPGTAALRRTAAGTLPPSRNSFPNEPTPHLMKTNLPARGPAILPLAERRFATGFDRSNHQPRPASPRRPPAATRRATRPVLPGVLALLLGLLLTAPSARLAAGTADVPDRMTFQSHLTDDSGTAVGAGAPVNKKMVFKIYTADTGGTVKWAESQIVTVNNGHFSVILGEGSVEGSDSHDLRAAMAGADVSDRFIEIKVSDTSGGSEQTLAPRLRLLPSPYAFLAQDAVKLGGAEPSVFLRNNANQSVSGSLTATSFTGIGTSLTALNASELTSGTVPSARLSGTYGSALTLNNSGNSFSGSGASLTALNAANIASGTLADARLSSNIPLKNAANIFVPGLRVEGPFNSPALLSFSMSGSSWGSETAHDDFRYISTSSGAADGFKQFNVGAGGVSIGYANVPTYGGGGQNHALYVNGNVGIGTTSPAGPLHIYEANGSATMNGATFNGGIGSLILQHGNAGGASSIVFRSRGDSSDYGFIQFQDDSTIGGSGEKSLLIIGTQNDGGAATTADNIALMPSGNVGIGTTTPLAPLHVVKSSYVSTFRTGNNAPGISLSNNGGRVNGDNYSATEGDNVTVDTSAIAAIFEGQTITRDIIWIGGTIQAASDRRAKHILGQSDGDTDLMTLRKLKITDFKWIDREKGNGHVQKKLVAQEVELVFPQAIMISPLLTAIPNVYELATAFDFNGATKTLTVTTGKAHEFKVGDKIDLYTDRAALKGVAVKVVSSGRQFVVDCEQAPQKVFVYGKYVKDFRSVDYDAIAMLNVSATQELARQVEALRKSEARIAELEQKVSRMDALERKLADLEKLVARAGEPRKEGHPAAEAPASEVKAGASR